MPHHRVHYQVKAPPQFILKASRDLAARLGWAVHSVEPNRVTVQDSGSGGWKGPVTLDVESHADGDGSIMRISGANSGRDPAQAAHVQTQVSAFETGVLAGVEQLVEEYRRHITQQTPPRPVLPPEAGPPLSEELAKLALLYERGLLTHEEFMSAKRKVIEGPGGFV